MKCLRLKGRWPWLGLFMVPALAWAVVLAVVPTDWARARLEAKIARATGRSVRIGALKLGITGNLRILDLSIAEPRTATDPWLKVAEARIDVHLGQVMLGHCEPNEIQVDGLALRLWRKKDGTPEVADILRAAPDPSTIASAHGPLASTARVGLKVSGASIRVIDEPSQTRVDLTSIDGRGTFGCQFVTIDSMKGAINGGTIELAAKLDRNPTTPRFEVEVRALNVGIDRGMAALGLFIPIASGSTDPTGDKLMLQVAVKGHGSSRHELRRSIQGQGSIALDPIDLQGSKLFAELDTLGDWPSKRRVAAVTSDFSIENGRFLTDDLTIRASDFPLVLEGWTDFDGRFDLKANGDRIAAQLPREVRAWIKESKVGMDQIAGLRVFGTPTSFDMTIHGRPIDGDPTRPDSDRARFRESARRIRDRFFH